MTLAVDIAFHWGLDMMGAVTIACLMRGCSNPEHVHSGIVGVLTRRPWLTQTLMAFVTASAIVHSLDLLGIVMHFGIDMTGALTLGCLLNRAAREDASALMRRPWLTQTVLALIVAAATVLTIG